MNVTHELGDIYKYPPEELKGVTLQHKLIIAQNICYVISAVHRAGYVFGDFNPMNIGVNIKDGTVAFFDADTYHFKDSQTGHMHRCKVGCPGYVAPELIATCKKFSAAHPEIKDTYAHAPLPTFTVATDNFALAIHMFRLLMNGYTPYNGIPETASVSLASPGRGDIAVERNNYCFAPGNKPMSAATPELTSLPQEVQALFTRAFGTGYATPSARPSSDEWMNALASFEQELKRCNKDSNHLYYKGLSTCPYCAADERYRQALIIGSTPSLKQKTFTTAPIVQVPATPPRPTNTQTSSNSYTPQRAAASSATTRYGSSQNTMSTSTKVVIAVVIVAIIVIFSSIMGNVDRDTVDFITSDTSVAVGETIQVRVSSSTSSLTASYSQNIEVNWNNSKRSGKTYVLDVTGLSVGRAELTVYKQSNEKKSSTIHINVVESEEGKTEIDPATVITSKEHSTKDAALVISTNTPVSDSISGKSSANWYVFTLEEPGVITAAIDHESLNSSYRYWTLYLYQSDGSTNIDGGSNAWYVVGDENLQSCEIGLAAGKYFAKITPYSSSQWSENKYDFTISYTPSGDWEKELNNDKYSATEVALNQQFMGATTNEYDADWFSFSLPSDGVISVGFEHELLNSSYRYWTMYIFQGDGDTHYDGGSQEWYIVGDGTGETCKIGLPAGNYYLKVTPYSSSQWSSNTYEISIAYTASEVWEKEINSDKYSANEVSLNTTFYGATTNEYDADWYKFTLYDNGYISVGFEHELLNSSYRYWTMYIFRDDGDTHYDGGSQEWYIVGDGTGETCNIGLPAGNYY